MCKTLTEYQEPIKQEFIKINEKSKLSKIVEVGVTKKGVDTGQITTRVVTVGSKHNVILKIIKEY